MDLMERIHSGLTGKNIGGTLGMAFEGSEIRPEVDFYSPVPKTAVANDDLDLQLVWLAALEEHKLKLNAGILGTYWSKYIDVHWDEYGTALRNLKDGLQPPLTGLHNNNFTDGLGAAIRSEVWAAAFAGKPRTAAWFALQDAMVDHHGDGVYGEVFWAAAEAVVFGGGTIEAGLAEGKALLPEKSRLKKLFAGLDELKAAGKSFEDAYSYTMKHFASYNFTDVVMNGGYTYAALLWGGHDFERTILLANSCANDCDCTAATAGTLVAASKGFAGIPERWHKVVGDTISVGAYIKLAGVPKTLKELSERLVKLQREFADAPGLPELQPGWDIPECRDFSENRAYTVSGKKILFDGIRLDAARYPHIWGEMAEFHTVITVEEEKDAVNLMVASRGLFIVHIDGEMAALKGDQACPVPAHHRVRGGRIIPLNVKAKKSFDVKITLYPASPLPDVFVGLYDWNNAQVKAKFEA